MKHGIVTSKNISEEGNVILTVQSSRAGVLWEPVTVLKNQPGAVQNIEEEWHVAVERCDDGLWVCVGVLNTEPTQLPNSLNGQEHSMKFDDGTEISARKNNNGNYDVTISASGNVTIGDASNAVKLAVENHTHNYTWTGTEGSGTTDPPNEAGTETAVE